MTPSKQTIIASIQSARAELEKTIAEMEHLPVMDPASVGFTVHALNNFLTVSSGCISLLRDRLEDHSDPDVRNWLEGLQHATTLMIGAARGITATSTMHRMQFRTEVFDFVTLTERTCDFYQRIADRKKIGIEFASQIQRREAFTDRVAIAAVLDNLLSNAVKYSPEGATVKVSVSEDTNSLVCSVRDEGAGISVEESQLLFTRGARLSNRPTGGEDSTGYGLAVAKELLDELGGAIWCDSLPRSGSCFSFRIPANQRPASVTSDGTHQS